MHRRTLLLFLLTLSSRGASAADESWLLTVDLWGNPQHSALTLTRDGHELSGMLAREPLSGTARGDRLRFSVTAADGSPQLGIPQDVWVHQYEYTKTGKRRPTQEWVIPAMHVVSRWVSLAESEAWSTWKRAARPTDHLSDPELLDVSGNAALNGVPVEVTAC